MQDRHPPYKMVWRNMKEYSSEVWWVVTDSLCIYKNELLFGLRRTRPICFFFGLVHNCQHIFFLFCLLIKSYNMLCGPMGPYMTLRVFLPFHFHFISHFLEPPSFSSQIVIPPLHLRLWQSNQAIPDIISHFKCLNLRNIEPKLYICIKHCHLYPLMYALRVYPLLLGSLYVVCDKNI